MKQAKFYLIIENFNERIFIHFRNSFKIIELNKEKIYGKRI